MNDTPRTQPQQPIRLYGMALSGHCHRVELFLSLLEPAAARVIQLFKRPDDPAQAMARANALFTVMEGELARQPFLAGNEPTIADIANYSYAARAPEGNVSLEPHPRLRAWLARIEALPGFVAMPKSAVGLAQ